MNTKGLGPEQLSVIEKLKSGWWISVHVDLSSSETESCITNDTDYLKIKGSTILSLVKRGIIKGETVYTTVQPDTETIHYKMMGGQEG